MIHFSKRSCLKIRSVLPSQKSFNSLGETVEDDGTRIYSGGLPSRGPLWPGWVLRPRCLTAGKRRLQAGHTTAAGRAVRLSSPGLVHEKGGVFIKDIFIKCIFRVFWKEEFIRINSGSWFWFKYKYLQVSECVLSFHRLTRSYWSDLNKWRWAGHLLFLPRILIVGMCREWFFTFEWIKRLFASPWIGLSVK